MDTSLLATGGIAAAAVGFWGQVQSAFRYVSSFVVVSAAVRHPISYPVTAYLKTEWRPVPSGQFFYVGEWYKFRDKPMQMLVPFRLRSAKVIYFRRFQFVVKTGDSDITLWSIRGLVDFDRVISDAIDLYHLRNSGQMIDALGHEVNARYFFIEKVLGREKGMFARDKSDSGPGAALLEGHASAASSGDAPESFDTTTDLSFKYSRDQYIWTEDVDPFEGLYFDPVVLECVGQAAQWLSMGDWYLARSIPWRLGWAAHGPGGTGKSSLAKATARKLNLPIYQYFLATLSDQEFMDRWEGMRTPCVALFEDFDTVFNKRVPLTEHKSLTFQCVLNAISGVSSINGVFLIVTTNHLDAIDEAMGVSCGKDGISTRPGRIDRVIEVGAMSVQNRQKMAASVLRDWPEIVFPTVKQGEGMMPAQFQELCIQTAFHRLEVQQRKEAA
jgi:hypothetical protein